MMSLYRSPEPLKWCTFHKNRVLGYTCRTPPKHVIPKEDPGYIPSFGRVSCKYSPRSEALLRNRFFCRCYCIGLQRGGLGDRIYEVDAMLVTWVEWKRKHVLCSPNYPHFIMLNRNPRRESPNLEHIAYIYIVMTCHDYMIVYDIYWLFEEITIPIPSSGLVYLPRCTIKID